VFSHGLRAVWDVVWLMERFSSVDAALLRKWAKQLAMPRSFWVPAHTVSKGFGLFPEELMKAVPRDDRQSRLERVADLRMFSAIENAFEINPISKNGFFLLLHDSSFGRARHVASLFRPEERESRRSAAKMLKNADTAGNHSLLSLQLREGMTHWKQFRSLSSR
jgi:hypothetical protein